MHTHAIVIKETGALVQLAFFWPLPLYCVWIIAVVEMTVESPSTAVPVSRSLPQGYRSTEQLAINLSLFLFFLLLSSFRSRTMAPEFSRRSPSYMQHEAKMRCDPAPRLVGCLREKKRCPLGVHYRPSPRRWNPSRRERTVIEDSSGGQGGWRAKNARTGIVWTRERGGETKKERERQWAKRSGKRRARRQTTTSIFGCPRLSFLPLPPPARPPDRHFLFCETETARSLPSCCSCRSLVKY